MKLEDVKFGSSHYYYCSETQTKCCVVASHNDDGACLIIEIFRGGDLSSEIQYSEACYLYEWR